MDITEEHPLFTTVQITEENDCSQVPKKHTWILLRKREISNYLIIIGHGKFKDTFHIFDFC